MKAVLGFLLVCAVVLSVDAVCDPTLCTPGSPHTTDTRCNTWREYQACIQRESDGCTTVAERDSIQPSIDSLISLRYNIECGAAGITISLFTLLLSLIAAFLKL